MKSTHSLSIALAAIAVSPAIAAAQTTKWVVDPVYESISLVCNNSIIQAKDAESTVFYSLNGEKIFETKGDAATDAEGNIILLDDKGMITGFVNADGKKFDLPAVKPIGDAAFKDGLLMYDVNGAYGTVDTEGNRHDMPQGVIRAFPYSHGYAMYQAYAQPDKKKDPYYAYSSLGSEVSYSINGKNFDRDDLKFLSSVAPDGRGVAVIGDKLYWFDSSKGAFEDMIIEGSQPSLTERTVNDLKNFGKTGVYTFRGHMDPKRTVTMIFTKEFVPDKIVSGDVRIEFSAPEQAEEAKAEAAVKESTLPASNFSLAEVDSIHSVLKYKGSAIPSGKFEAYGSMFGDYAAVKEAGKWGILTYVAPVNYDFVLRGANDEDNIAFRHAKAKAELIVDLPAGVSAAEFAVSVPDSMASLMTIDEFDRTEKTASGITRVSYPVTLRIPPTITDQVTEITYPIDVIIGGEKQSSQNVVANAWYVKNYIMTIDADPDNALDAYGNVQFVVNVEKDQPDGADYPINVQIVPEAPMSPITWSSSKITETKYQFKVANLMPGANRVWIVMNEDGCPTINMPFELENSGAATAVIVPEQQPTVQPQAAPAAAAQYQAVPQQPVQQVQYQQAVPQQQYQQAVPQQMQQAAPQQYQQAASQYQQVQQAAPQQYQQAAPQYQQVQQAAPQQYQQAAPQQYQQVQQAAPQYQQVQQAVPQYQVQQPYQYQQAQVFKF
ncbi:MAG: hypothetical protein NC102_01625 [Clostridium sp.]|nr:hypothetical protein [Clostridium sp.]